jgi:signal transduction histidine kinase
MAAERGYKELKDSTGITDVCCSLGYAFVTQENYDLAKTQFLRGLSYSHGRDDQWEFTMLYKIAECEFDGGRYDSARVYLQHARNFMQHHDVDDYDDTVMGLEADFALRDKRCDEALTVYRTILDKMRKEGYTADRIGSQMLYVAGAHTCAQEHDKAYRMAHDALLIAERTGMLELQVRALRIMANAKEEIGDPGEALRLQKRMVALRDSLERNESLSVLSSSLLGMEMEEQLRADSLTAAFAISEARATADRSRTQRIILIGLTVLVLVIAALLVNRYRLKRRLQVEQLRTRLARDLHDDIGGTLSSISILSNVVKKRAEASGDADSAASMAKISERSQRLMRDMSDIVWSVDPGRDSMADLVGRMREFGGAVLEPKGIAFHFNAPENVLARDLSVEVKKNLYLIFKEAVNNAAKHAGARSVFVDVSMNARSLHVQVEDDGMGMRTEAPVTGHGGNGLRNMRARAEEIGALFSTGTSDRGGVRVAVELVMN